MTNALSLRPGDRLPDFILPGLDGKLRKFIWSFNGDPVALLAVDDLGNLDAGNSRHWLAPARPPPPPWSSWPAMASPLWRPCGRSWVAAAVFSCSLMHVALTVTRGRRFVLTTFFHHKT